jgi:His-Xaa-Ser system protein HxsD
VIVAEPESAQESRLGFSRGTDHISLEVDESVYPLEALYGACYLFLDKCFVYLSRPKPQVVEARLTAREAASPNELEALAGEFANELLSQALRLQLSQATGRIREYYTAAALRAAASAPSVDELLAELESEDLLEDPLEIMVPWEEKHGAAESEAEPKKEPGGSNG